MYSVYRNKKDVSKNLTNSVIHTIKTELDQNIDIIDPFLTHIILKIQPWLLTCMVIFGLYFVLIITILILIIRNDLKN